MRKLTHARAGVVALALTAVSICDIQPARAEDVPSNDVRIGMYAIFFHVTSNNISGPFIPPGVNLNLDLKNTETLYLAYIRRLNSFLDLEFAFGIPPKTKTIGKGSATVGSVPFNGQEIATAKWLSPSVLLEYKFLSEGSAFRPYVGVGINYTTFYDRQVTTAGQQAIGGPTRLSLTSSVGPVATAGIKYRPNTHWHVALSYSIGQVDSNLKADTAGEIHTARVHFGPQALVVAAGYSF
jgi:outer membrane protein